MNKRDFIKLGIVPVLVSIPVAYSLDATPDEYTINIVRARIRTFTTSWFRQNLDTVTGKAFLDQTLELFKIAMMDLCYQGLVYDFSITNTRYPTLDYLHFVFSFTVIPNTKPTKMNVAFRRFIDPDIET